MSDWRTRAACRDRDPDLFFPYPADDYARKAAKRVCDGCPVRDECLAYALERDEREGIWGGLGPLQRRRLAGAEPGSTRRQRRYRDRLASSGEEVPHGTRKGYADFGCKCAECRAAHARHNRVNRERARERREGMRANG